MNDPQDSSARIRRPVGPWPHEDYRSFRLICLEGLRLEHIRKRFANGLLDGIVATSSFRDVAAAQAKLRGHPVYRWLAKHVPRAVDTAADKTPFVQFRRVGIVVEYIPRIGSPAKPIRMDKHRQTAARAVERVQESIYSGALWFPNPAREEMLEELLDEAKLLLRSRKREAKSVKHPSLEGLAQELYEQTGTVDVALLIEVATVRNLECDERTARRYVRKAEQAQS